LRIAWRRRREGKTNYRRRKKAILSRKPLLYVFVSNKNINAQIIKPEIGGDKVLAHANTRHLLKMGWKFSRKNLPAAYLVGLLLGKRAKEAGINEAILYTGVKGFTPGSRVAAVVKGVMEAGIHVPFDKEVLPDEDRLKGKHIVDYFNDLKKKDPELAKRRFSALWDKNIEELPSLVEKFKVKILGEGG